MQIQIDGNSIYASTGGVEHIDGQPVLVFIHGAGMDHTVWVLFNRFLARAGYNTLAVDLPGHGKSEGQPLSSVEDMAQWLTRFLHEAGIEHVTLIGHSMGSLVAVEAAALLGVRLDRIVLLGVSCPMPVGEPLLSAAQSNKHAAIDMIMIYGHAYCSQLGGNPVAGINIVNSSMRLLECSLDGRLYADLKACNEYSNGLQAAAGIKAPGTLILGKEDRMTPPPAAKPLIEVLVTPRVTILENCGHMLLTEQPESVHRELMNALVDSHVADV